MPDPTTLAVFSLAALALIVVPGPAVLYIVAQSVHRGRAAGVVSAAGVANGGLVHVAAAAVGLSALLVQSAVAFEVVKIAGAVYLVYLGVRRLLGRDGLGAERSDFDARPLRRIYRQGVVVNILNPKTALFFLAFLPQFVDPNGPAPALQVIVLGMTFVILAFASDSLWALAAGTTSRWLRGNARALRAERYASGGVLVGLGAVTALARK
jgi:threonine/homoserine/homoserine lactone efflux protein